MQITFWGAAQTVTGSQHLLSVGNQQILLDCGFFQGRRAEAYAINRKLPFEAGRVDAMLLSHAHIDHSGNIPNLVKSGFDGQIYCTHATRDLATTMLRDSGSIQEEDIYFLNKHNKGGQTLEPIYGVVDAERAMHNFASFDYGRWMQVTSNTRANFLDAGHMLGSAIVQLELREGDKQVRFCFSGDLGRKQMPILRDPEPMPESDYLILESTYGGREHGPITTVDESLRDAIATAARRNGKVIIPAFAVGRAQEIVYRLNALINAGKLADIPVFVDSPLAVNVTEVFRNHAECYDEEVKTMMRTDPDGTVFGFNRLKYVRTASESKAINGIDGPAIIISASGMCENGRVLHHLRHTISDARNMVLFVSYQAGHTLGARILAGEKYVKILGDEFTVRAEVRRIEAFSGHADHSDLIEWVKPRARGLKAVFLVHGEIDSMNDLSTGLREIGVPAVHAPQRGTAYDLS